MYFGCRAITQGAWMQMKKPAWQSMPVLNVRNLNQEQSDTLSATYDLVSKEISGHSHSSTAIRRGSKSMRPSARHCRCRLSLRSASFWFESRV